MIKPRFLMFSAVVLILFAALTYWSFAKFVPETEAKNRGVFGAQTSNLIDLPYPNDAQVLGIDKTGNGKIENIKVIQTPVEAQTFYKNILTAEGWDVESQTIEGDSTDVKYKKGENRITITAVGQEDTNRAIVTISVSTY